MSNKPNKFHDLETEWETPQELFSIIDRTYHFDIDVCATRLNTKCSRYWDVVDNGLEQDWQKLKCWCNPPFDNRIKSWVKKAYTEVQKDELISTNPTIVVCLLPVHTDTQWWHDYVAKARILYFLRGRLRFTNRSVPGYQKNGSFKVLSVPFPSVIAVFRRSTYRQFVFHWDWRNNGFLCNPNF